MSKFLEEVSLFTTELLPSFLPARDTSEYLRQRISEYGRKSFHFGYFPDENHLNVLLDHFPADKLAKCGLLYYRFSEETGQMTPGSPLQNHNLVMPYRDGYGKVIALVGRSILADKYRAEKKISKYKNTSFSKSECLFGLDRAKKSIATKNRAIVVEGQFDAISAHIAGIDNVVALGSGSMSFGQFALISRYTDRITMLLDNDDAGKAGMDRAIERFGSKTVNQAKLPDGYKDIDQFLSEVGTDGRDYIEQL